MPVAVGNESPPCSPPSFSPVSSINGGLQVINPSKTLYAQIMAYLETSMTNMDFADQSLLSDLFRGRWVALPYVYNALKTLRWEGVHAQIWRDENVKNIARIPDICACCIQLCRNAFEEST